MVEVDDLNARFGQPGRVRFEAGAGGLTLCARGAPGAEGQVYLHGAHVTHYARAGEAPSQASIRARAASPPIISRGSRSASALFRYLSW